VGDDAEISSFDRLFPNQDKLPENGKGLGNLISMPFQGDAGLVGLFVGLLRGRALWWWMNENIKNNPLRFKNKYPMLK